MIRRSLGTGRHADFTDPVKACARRNFCQNGTLLMQTLRRRLASCALLLVVFQAALALAAPLSACCVSRSGGAAAHAVQGNDETECCPAGAHPPGECPRHARCGAASKLSCRMQCDAPHGLQFLAGAVGMIPPPASSAIAIVAERFAAPAAPVTILQSVDPDSPPPRLC